MICITVEVHEDAVTYRLRVTAPCIGRAIEIAKGGRSGRRARVVFPIDPYAFFVPEGAASKEAA